MLYLLSQMLLKRQNFLLISLILVTLICLVRLLPGHRVQLVTGSLVTLEPEECIRTKKFEGGEVGFLS